MPSVAVPKDLSIVIGERFVELIQAVPEINPAKVHFARAYEIVPDELPCVSVEIGADLPLGQAASTSNYEYAEQTIYVDFYHFSNDAKAMIEIAYQRALVHRAITTDFTLGLPFVVQARFGGAGEPDGDGESGLPGWTMRAIFPVEYKFNDDDRTVFNTG